MKLSANATFKFGEFARLESLIVPKLLEGAKVGAQAVYEESQLLVPVDTGELKESGSTSVEWVGKQVTGYVQYSAGHGAFVEFGTGQRGAASPGAGSYPYSASWKGMIAQPYLRPAIDAKKNEVLDAFKEALAK